MANLVRTSRGRRSASGQYRMAILASSAAAAAGVSVTQALLRRRYAERAAQARRDADLGAGNDAPRIAAGPGNHAAGEPNGQPGEPERTQEAHRALRRNRPLLRVSRYLLPARFHRQDDRGLPEAERALSPARESPIAVGTVERPAQVETVERPAPVEAVEQPAPVEAVERPGAVETVESPAQVQPVESPAQAQATPEPAPVIPPTVPPTAQTTVERTPRAPSWSRPQSRNLAPLAPGLRRIYRRGRRALKQVKQKPTEERWQELRRRSKDLWYVSQLLESVSSKRMSKVTKQAHRLSDLLGEDRYLAKLTQRVRSSGLSKKDARMIGSLIARRRIELQYEAHMVAARLYRRKPRKFAKRMGLDQG